MLVRFNVPRGIDKVDYKVGVHTLDDSLANHPYLHLLIKEGDAEIVDGRTLPEIELPKPNLRIEGPAVYDAVEVPSKEEKAAKGKKEA
jgi:hypothetical protein